MESLLRIRLRPDQGYLLLRAASPTGLRAHPIQVKLVVKIFQKDLKEPPEKA
jgi:hypothetical protein